MVGYRCCAGKNENGVDFRDKSHSSRDVPFTDHDEILGRYGTGGETGNFGDNESTKENQSSSLECLNTIVANIPIEQ